MSAGVEDEPVDGAAPSAQEAADLVGPGRSGRTTPVITASGPATAQDTAERPRGLITVEQAYLAKLRAAGAASPSTPPAAVASVEQESPPSRAQPVPLRPGQPGSEPPVTVRRPPAAPLPPPHLRARPRIEPEQGILGLSRHTRSRLGSRLFNLFFVCVFALILIQMIVVLLSP